MIELATKRGMMMKILFL